MGTPKTRLLLLLHAALVLLQCTPAPCLASSPPHDRSLMVWLNEWTGPPGPQATWEARLADIAAHAENLTCVRVVGQVAL